MLIKLMINRSSHNVISKDLELISELNIKARNNFNISTPYLLLSPIVGVDLMNVNYIHIPELNRYYFVEKVMQESGKIFRLEIMVDVLSSFSDLVLSSYASVNRSVRKGDNYKGSLDYSYNKTVVEYNSDVTLESGSSIFMSTVGV